MERLDLENLDEAVWRKTTRSGGNGGNCVEVARVRGSKGGVRQELVALRDSKDPQGPKLVFTTDEAKAFAAGLRAGEFDDLIN